MSSTESEGGTSAEPFLDVDFFRSLVEHGSDAIVTIDEESTVVYANAPVEELLRVASLADQSRELFGVSETIAALEAEHGPAALAEAEEYQRLLARRAELHQEGADEGHGAADAEAAFRDLDT